MTQSEFLEALRDALSGQIPSDEVIENLRYYRSYFSDEMKKGRREQDILEELGDPRLIAKTIIDASKASAAGGRAESRRFFSGEERENEPQKKSRRTFRVSGWAAAGVLLLILFLIFFVLSLMFRAVFHLLFSLRGIVFWAAVLLVIGFLARRRR